jgi:hypothetical protein
MKWILVALFFLAAPWSHPAAFGGVSIEWKSNNFVENQRLQVARDQSMENLIVDTEVSGSSYYLDEAPLGRIYFRLAPLEQKESFGPIFSAIVFNSSPHRFPLEVKLEGDLLYSSWGPERDFVDYYEVVYIGRSGRTLSTERTTKSSFKISDQAKSSAILENLASIEVRGRIKRLSGELVTMGEALLTEIDTHALMNGETLFSMSSGFRENHFMWDYSLDASGFISYSKSTLVDTANGSELRLISKASYGVRLQGNFLKSSLANLGASLAVHKANSFEEDVFSISGDDNATLTEILLNAHFWPHQNLSFLTSLGRSEHLLVVSTSSEVLIEKKGAMEARIAGKWNFYGNKYFESSFVLGLSLLGPIQTSGLKTDPALGQMASLNIYQVGQKESAFYGKITYHQRKIPNDLFDQNQSEIFFALGGSWSL